MRVSYDAKMRLRDTLPQTVVVDAGAQIEFGVNIRLTIEGARRTCVEIDYAELRYALRDLADNDPVQYQRVLNALFTFT